MRSRAILLTALLPLAGALPALPPPLEIFSFRGGTHREFGRAVGARFRQKIADRLAASSALLHELHRAFVDPGAPQARIYSDFLELHNATFPGYLEEIVGYADGAGVNFHTLFVLNLREELGYFLNPESREALEQTGLLGVGHCSDISLMGAGDGDASLFGHNEDSGAADVGTTFMIRATDVGGTGTSFVAYVYAGDLATGAFGWNDAGVAFTLNALFPAPHEVAMGLARGFVSRALLDARTFDDATATAATAGTSAGYSVGHNYQLADLHQRRAVNVEAAARGRAACTPVRPGAGSRGKSAAVAFHANSLLHLADVAQVPHRVRSSADRLERAAQLPPPDGADAVLAVLGDTVVMEHGESIYRTGPPPGCGGVDCDILGFTLHTVLMDLERGVATVFAGNPMEGHVVQMFDMLSWDWDGGWENHSLNKIV